MCEKKIIEKSCYPFAIIHKKHARSSSHIIEGVNDPLVNLDDARLE